MQKIICEKCGADMEYSIKGNTQGYYCKNCEWSVVTSFLPDYLGDTIVYTVYLLPGQSINIDKIKTIASISSLNFIESKNFFSSDSKLKLYSGVAFEVLKIVKCLKSTNIEFEILPNFPYHS